MHLSHIHENLEQWYAPQQLDETEEGASRSG